MPVSGSIRSVDKTPTPQAGQVICERVRVAITTTSLFSKARVGLGVQWHEAWGCLVVVQTPF